MALFAERLLSGTTVAMAGSPAAAITGALQQLGARTVTVAAGLDDEQVEAAVRELGPVDVLVHDARGAFGAGALSGLRTAVDETWSVVRAVATGALIGSERGGRIVLLAPRAGAGENARAARAALENLARTLSVEWARYAITVTALAPGAATSDDQLATFVCFLASPAGGYYTGCRFELGAVTAA